MAYPIQPVHHHTMDTTHDPQMNRWMQLFGTDTGVYSVYALDGNDLGRKFFTGRHVECLDAMRTLIRRDRRWSNRLALIDDSTGRIMSHVVYV